MNKIQRTEVAKHILRIDKMDLGQLRSYCQKWYMAKEDINKKIFDKVVQGMDIKMAELMEYSDISPMAVIGDLVEGEI